MYFFMICCISYSSGQTLASGFVREAHEEIANQILKEVQSIIPQGSSENGATIGDSERSTENSRGNNKQQSTSETAIELLDRKAKLYFKDEYGTPQNKVQVGGHTETMQIGTLRFELYVSRLFYEEMDGQVIKVESLNEVVRILTCKSD